MDTSGVNSPVSIEDNSAYKLSTVDASTTSQSTSGTGLIWYNPFSWFTSINNTIDQNINGVTGTGSIDPLTGLPAGILNPNGQLTTPAGTPYTGSEFVKFFQGLGTTFFLMIGALIVLYVVIKANK